MDLRELLEAGAAQGCGPSWRAAATPPELWAVHVQGPDDVLPMRSHDAAEKYADNLNGSWAKYCAANPDETGFRPNLHAAVVPWDGDAKDHAALVERYENEPYEP